jgi:hypothetical protein
MALFGLQRRIFPKFEEYLEFCGGIITMRQADSLEIDLSTSFSRLNPAGVITQDYGDSGRLP